MGAQAIWYIEEERQLGVSKYRPVSPTAGTDAGGTEPRAPMPAVRGAKFPTGAIGCEATLVVFANIDSMDKDRSLREHLVNLLDMKGAHVDFKRTVSDVPFEAQGRTIEGVPASAWEQLEHMRIAQSDILEFSREASHESPKWPEGYWPSSQQPPTPDSWEQSVRAFEADLEEMKRLVQDPDSDLFEPFPWGKGQTLLREALLVADHNAYHIGQIVTLLRALGCWG